MIPTLNVVDGPDKGREFPLTSGGTLQVGRSQSTDTRLADAAVSRQHFQVEQGTVLKLMARDAADRYPSAADLLADLARVGKLTGVSA